MRIGRSDVARGQHDHDRLAVIHRFDLQRYVRTADLNAVYAAVDRVLASANVLVWHLQAVKYYFIPAGPLGLAGIVDEPTPEFRSAATRHRRYQLGDFGTARKKLKSWDLKKRDNE